MTITYNGSIPNRSAPFIYLLLLIGSLSLTACQSTRTVAHNGGNSPNGTSGVATKPWYEVAKSFVVQHNDFEATGTAFSLDSTRAVLKARHTSIAILQSKLQEILENLRTGMVNNGVAVAKQPLFILQTRTCLNDLYQQLNPDKVAVQNNDSGYKAYVQMHMERSQLLDNWRKSFSGNETYLEATNDSPIIRAWLHPEVNDSTASSGK